MERARSKKASGVAGTGVGRKGKQHALQTFPPGKAGKVGLHCVENLGTDCAKP